MTVVERYTRTAIVLHWLIAALMIVNVVLGLTAESLPETSIRLAIDTHKSIGITVIGLFILRLLWRVTHAPPAMPRHYPGWERNAAHLVHAALYLVIIALPVTGWMHDSAWKGADSHPMTLFGLVPWPRIGWIMALDPADKEHVHDVFFSWHAWLAYALYALVALHIAGALKHQLLDGEKELQRMLP